MKTAAQIQTYFDANDVQLAKLVEIQSIGKEHGRLGYYPNSDFSSDADWVYGVGAMIQALEEELNDESGDIFSLYSDAHSRALVRRDRKGANHAVSYRFDYGKLPTRIQFFHAWHQAGMTDSFLFEIRRDKWVGNVDWTREETYAFIKETCELFQDGEIDIGSDDEETHPRLDLASSILYSLSIEWVLPRRERYISPLAGR